MLHSAIAMQSGRIPQLDGLRGLAILMVMVWHYLVQPLQGRPGSEFVAAGRLTWSGVDLFFVLSGFLIGGILLDQRDSANRFRTFYLRRAYRILPIYLVVCITVEACFAATQFHERSMPWWSYLTFTQNMWLAGRNTFWPLLSYTWSLAVEEQFYLTLPWLIFFLPRRPLVAVLTFTIVAAPVLRVLVLSGGNADVAIHVLSFTRADTLAFGVLAAICVRHQPTLDLLAGKRWMFRTMAVLPLGILVIAIMRDWRHGSLPMAIYGYSALALFYFLMLLELTVSPSTRFASFFRNGTLRWLGGISYGAYLLHQVVKLICDRVLIPTNAPMPWMFVSAVVAAAITLGVAQLSWTHFESKLVGYARRFTYEKRAVASAVEEELVVAAARA